eukprot:302376-Lingulodinium_polyedra.AAC.1
MILNSLVPSGWTVLWGEGRCATALKDSDWATHPAASQEDAHMFPDGEDRQNKYRQWRKFLKAGRII